MSLNKLNKISSMPDEELIRRYKQEGKEAYISQLYQRHYDKVYIVARSMVNDREAAKDIVMEVFEKILLNLKDTDVQSFSNWLFIITRNECTRYLRKQSNSLKKITEWSNIQRSSENYMENSPLERLLLEEKNDNTRSEIAAAMNALSAQQKACIQLFYYEGKSYREIAQMTGYMEKEVKSYLQNGKKKLEKALRKNL